MKFTMDVKKLIGRGPRALICKSILCFIVNTYINTNMHLRYPYARTIAKTSVVTFNIGLNLLITYQASI